MVVPLALVSLAAVRVALLVILELGASVAVAAVAVVIGRVGRDHR
jgi:hypothetical protein